MLWQCRCLHLLQPEVADELGEQNQNLLNTGADLIASNYCCKLPSIYKCKGVLKVIHPMVVGLLNCGVKSNLEAW